MCYRHAEKTRREDLLNGKSEITATLEGTHVLLKISSRR